MGKYKLEINLKNYSDELIRTLKKIDQIKINLLANKVLEAILEGRKIILMGNGGSAANASHIAGDYIKTFSFLGYKPRISTPSDNTCFLTAVSNDSDFNESFFLYLRSVIEKNSIVIMLSG